MRYLDSISKDAIALCCKHYNTSRVEVAQKLKLNLDRLEAGQLTYKQLDKLSDYFGKDNDFFIEDDEEIKLEDISSPKFRKISKQVSASLDIDIIKTIENVEWHRELFTYLYKEVLDETPTKFRPPSDIKSTEKISEWLGIDKLRKTKKKLEFQDYRLLLEKKGVLVFVSSPYAGNWHIRNEIGVLGFSLYYSCCPIIWIKHDINCQVFTLMHELRHLLNKGDYVDQDSEEIEADEFATELLLPKKVLADIIDINNIPRDFDLLIKQCKKVKSRLGISVQATLRRLSDLGIIDKSLSKKYINCLNNNLSSNTKKVRCSRKRDLEVLNIFGKKYIALILDAWASKEITIVKAGKYLDFINGEDFQKLDKRILDEGGFSEND